MNATPTRWFLGGLLQASHRMTMEELPAKVSEYAARAGLSGVLIYVADLQQDVLRLLADQAPNAGNGDEGTPELRIEGTLAGRSFQLAEPVSANGPRPGPGAWWVPLAEGGERVGVLRVSTEEADEQSLRDILDLAVVVTLMIIAKRPGSDYYYRLVRTRPMTVAAEMQWNLMPPRGFANDAVLIGAALEPAYEISGDTYEYALAGHTVHLAIFDAMGHDMAAGLAANLAVAACRNNRRQGAGLVETGEAIDRTLTEQFNGHGRHVTAVLANLDTHTGRLSWITHGHHPPLILRHGSRITRHCPPAHPLGTDLGIRATLCQEQLQPGDRVVLYTDGITEARDADGREFGLDRFTDFLIRHDADRLPVPETLRRLTHSIMDYHGGRLQDDATVLLMAWHGKQPADRT
ncbi:PP2C family protein-serine/threonine phosphatase [Streptomyces sp. NPDC052236]|uniref:PP2C family protein-serine/threonine phosphatase n=1 Tax=Streptomyces sp. NPDC052236 TaxID=3365686 RepID=UPI0037D3F5A6